MTIEEFLKQIKAWLETEEITDELYRIPVLHAQLGEFERFIYHDPEINPKARSAGTKEDEVIACGESICHLVALAISRGIDIREAIEKGLERLEEQEGYEKSGQVTELEGKIVLKGAKGVPGIKRGKARVIKSKQELQKLQDETIKEEIILVIEHIDLSSLRYLSGLTRTIKGIVTDQGGRTSHAVIFARDIGIPCVIGTGEATKKISDRDEITIDGERGTVEIKKIGGEKNGK